MEGEEEEGARESNAMHQAEKRRQQHSRGGLWNKGIRERREKTGQCLNIEHMSVSPLPTKIEATTVDHRTYDHLEQTKRERERFSLGCLFCGLVFAVTRPSSFVFQSSVLFLLPSFLLLFFFSYFIRLFSRREEFLYPSFLKWIEICKRYIPCFER